MTAPVELSPLEQLLAHPKPWLSAEEVAAIEGVTATAIRQRVRRGQIPGALVAPVRVPLSYVLAPLGLIMLVRPSGRVRWAPATDSAA